MLVFTACSDDKDDEKKDDPKPPSGEEMWCGWSAGDPTQCQPFDPAAPNAENPGMNQLQACTEYGTVYDTEAACKAGEANKDPLQWCAWTPGDPTNCQPINKPEDESEDNPGMTNWDACDTYGKVYDSEEACVTGETGKLVEYCDWGPLDTTKPAGEQGGCWPIKEGDEVQRANCVAWGEVVLECPRGVGL